MTCPSIFTPGSTKCTLDFPCLDTANVKDATTLLENRVQNRKLGDSTAFNDIIDQFRPRLRAIIDQNGVHIEHFFT